MNDVEARQRKLVEKHRKAVQKEENGDEDMEEDKSPAPVKSAEAAPDLSE